MNVLWRYKYHLSKNINNVQLSYSELINKKHQSHFPFFIEAVLEEKLENY